MKNLKPIGIPLLDLLENLFAKTFDSSKLEEDAERVRQAYRDKGYYNAAVEEPEDPDSRRGRPRCFTFRPNKGKRIDILMPVEEGDRYRLGGITFHRQQGGQNVKRSARQFAIKDGEWFNATLISKGWRTSRRPTASWATSTSAPSPSQLRRSQDRLLDIDIDEGKPFYVSRIEFQGNTSPATASSAANCCSKKARSTTPSSGSTACCASTSSTTSIRSRSIRIRSPPGYRSRHRRPAAQGQGKGQELDRPQRRRQRPVGRVPRPELPDQQLPRPGRNAERAGQPGQRQPPVALRLQRSPTSATARSTWASRSSTPSRTTTRPRTTRRRPAQSANLTAAQQSLLQNYNNSTKGLNFSVSYPLPRHNFQRVGFTYSLTSRHHGVQHGVAEPLPEHRFRSGIQGRTR
jgi:hypothetical protein